MNDPNDSRKSPEPARPTEPVTVALGPGAEPSEPVTVDLQPQATPSASGTPHTGEPLSEQAPRRVGDYEVLGEIQRGGMGVVYRARERHSGRLVALKMMLDETVYGDADLRRFILEARATAELHHPGIVAIHAWGEHEGHPFYTMDFVSGEPLSRLLQTGPLSVERTVRYLIGITRAVAAAHAQGIVHRDLKPSNIMIDAADQPRVLDFGLAKRRRGERREAEQENAPPETRSVEAGARPPGLGSASPLPPPGPATERGAILGTPAYMAPEQARGEHHRVSAATDVHALGTICYEMLAGRPPFHAESTMETLLQVADRTPPPLRVHNPRVHTALEAICTRCLAKDPAERYSDAGALGEELERCWRGLTHSRRFARMTLLAGALVVVLQVLQLANPGPWARGEGWLFRLAAWASSSCGPAVQLGTQLLAILTGLFVFNLLPALAWLALVVWLSAWIWFSGRGMLLGAALGILAAALWLIWPWLSASAVFPALLSGTAFTACAVPALRWWSRRSRASRGTSSSGSDPYLQRLFAVRGESGRKFSAHKKLAEVKHADVEPGKILMHGQQCLLRWGRQQSLDRAVLIWLDTSPVGAGSIAPGVFVRHPGVLTLHAVGPCPEGYFLVTEPVAATPLAELLERRPLTSEEAVPLATGIARALQAFHDQGACHGRLSAEWILVRGESEPLLCPCGVPSQQARDRLLDIQAVARLLLEWLPPRGRRWQLSSHAVLYRVCEGALAGAYTRAGDLASDLENAARIAEARRHERITNASAAILYTLGLLAAALFVLAGPLQWAGLAGVATAFLSNQFLWFVPGIMLYGYGHGRTVVHRLRHPLHIAARSAWLGRRTGYALAVVAGLATLPAVLACLTLSSLHGLAVASTLLLGLAVMTGFWGLGILFAGVRTFGEVLFGSLQELRAETGSEPVDDFVATDARIL